MQTDRTHPGEHRGDRREADDNDDAADIRYSLTALGEAVLADADETRRGARFHGFGPCIAVA